MHRVIALTLLLASPALAGEALPKGPPWHRDLASAHAQAVREGKTIFVYFTKTY